MTALRVAERYALREHGEEDDHGRRWTRAEIHSTGLMKVCTGCQRKGVAFKVVTGEVYDDTYYVVVWSGRARSAEGSKARIGCTDLTSYGWPRSARWFTEDKFGCPACFPGPWDGSEEWQMLVAAHLGPGSYEVPAPGWFREALRAEHGRRGDSDEWLRRGYMAFNEAEKATSDGARRLAVEIRNRPHTPVFVAEWVKLVMRHLVRLLPYEDSARQGRAMFWAGVRSGLMDGGQPLAQSDARAPKLFLVRSGGVVPNSHCE